MIQQSSALEALSGAGVANKIPPEASPDAPFRFGPRPRRRPEERILMAPAKRHVPLNNNREFEAATDDKKLSSISAPDAARPLKKPKPFVWICVGVLVPSLTAALMVMLSPFLHLFGQTIAGSGPPTFSRSVAVSAEDRFGRMNPKASHQRMALLSLPHSVARPSDGMQAPRPTDIKVVKQENSVHVERDTRASEATSAVAIPAPTRISRGATSEPFPTLSFLTAHANAERIFKDAEWKDDVILSRKMPGSVTARTVPSVNIDLASETSPSSQLSASISFASQTKPDDIVVPVLRDRTPPPPDRAGKPDIDHQFASVDSKMSASKASIADRANGLGVASSSLPEGMPTRLLLRYLANNADARRRAEALAIALIADGFEVRDMRGSSAATRTALNYFYQPEAAVAQKLGRVVGVRPTRAALDTEGTMVGPGTVLIDVSAP